MIGHVANRPSQARLRLDVSDRAEQTCDDVERGVEFEASHVALVERDVRVFLASNLQHFWASVQAFDSVVLLEVSDMVARSTCNI